jgi:hypothetical protein
MRPGPHLVWDLFLPSDTASEAPVDFLSAASRLGFLEGDLGDLLLEPFLRVMLAVEGAAAAAATDGANGLFTGDGVVPQKGFVHFLSRLGFQPVLRRVP